MLVICVCGFDWLCCVLSVVACCYVLFAFVVVWVLLDFVGLVFADVHLGLVILLAFVGYFCGGLLFVVLVGACC